ncbi:MAG: DUF6690 family protein [Planctomycetota bacterium]
MASEPAATAQYLVEFALAVTPSRSVPDRFYATFTSSHSYYLAAPRSGAPQRRYSRKERRFLGVSGVPADRWSKIERMRRLFWFACFVGAVAGPYLWSNPQVTTAWKSRALNYLQQLTAAPPATEPESVHGPFSGMGGSGPATGFESSETSFPFVSTLKPVDSQTGELGAGSDEIAKLPADGPRLAGPANADFDALFRFEIVPEWVTDQWSRVSPVRSDEGWQGLRVPLVTGMAADDLAGSLTYYFDAWGRLQLIAFQGTTGDARRVTAWSASQGLRREPSFAAELFTRRWNGRATSVLAIRRPAIISSQLPNQRQEVLLELSPPNSRFEVSRDMQAWLRANRPSR